MRLLAAVLLGLALASPALGREPSFQEHVAVQESPSRVHDAELDFENRGLTMLQRP